MSQKYIIVCNSKYIPVVDVSSSIVVTVVVVVVAAAAVSIGENLLLKYMLLAFVITGL
jgi:hypothetical protein